MSQLRRVERLCLSLDGWLSLLRLPILPRYLVRQGEDRETPSMKCPECGSTELRRDAGLRWDTESNRWALIDEEWTFGSFVWCANCAAEFDEILEARTKEPALEAKK